MEWCTLLGLMVCDTGTSKQRGGVKKERWAGNLKTDD